MVFPKIQMLKFESYSAPNGSLTVLTEFGRPFVANRIFSIVASRGSVRGEHAHRECSQLLICVSGSIEVLTHDGFSQTSTLLDNPSRGLLIPPLVWASQTFCSEQAVLVVVCDNDFDESEYVKSFEGFMELVESCNPS